MPDALVDRSPEWDVLSKLDLFASLANGELEALVDATKARVFRKGEVIYHQEDPSGSIFVLASGFVKLQLMSQAGKRVTIGWRQDAGWFGILSHFDQDERPVTAICLEDSRILVINREFFGKFLVQHPAFANELLKHMAKGWRRTIERLSMLACLDAQGRLIRVLIELSRFYEPSSERLIRPCVTQSELASFANTSRESVNRLLASFEDKGWVKASSKGLRILDAESLSAASRANVHADA